MPHADRLRRFWVKFFEFFLREKLSIVEERGPQGECYRKFFSGQNLSYIWAL